MNNLDICFITIKFFNCYGTLLHSGLTDHVPVLAVKLGIAVTPLRFSVEAEGNVEVESHLSLIDRAVGINIELYLALIVVDEIFGNLTS